MKMYISHTLKDTQKMNNSQRGGFELQFRSHFQQRTVNFQRSDETNVKDCISRAAI